MLHFRDGNVDDLNGGSGTYEIDEDEITLDITQGDADIHLLLLADDMSDYEFIEGGIAEFDVNGESELESRLDEVEEFEGLDFTLRRTEEYEEEEDE